MNIEQEEGRERLTDFQYERVQYIVGEGYDERVQELELHTVKELADYVWKLAMEVPQGETLTRKQLYGWEAKSVEPYLRYGKKDLIARIITMEQHDDKRAKKEHVPLMKAQPEPESEKKPAQYRAVGEEKLKDV